MISDKLTAIAENEQRVYDAGYEAGKISGVVEYLSYVKKVEFHTLNIFGKAEVELNLDSCVSLNSLCQVTNSTNTNTTVEHLIINNATPITLQNMLNCNYLCGDNTLKRVTLNINTANVLTFHSAFNCNFALEIVDGNPLDCSGTSSTTALTNIFNYCSSLIEVRFVKNTITVNISFKASKLLSDESIQSIIDGLADLTGSDAQTITVHADVEARMTDEQKATITSKNWTLAV